ASEAHRICFAGGANTFLPRSACDIFDPKKWSSPEYDNGAFFRGKIVLLGPEGSFMQDLKRTPVGVISGPELHLNAINA
ncbi:CHASE2 domain-containing protein, partial [Propionibacterium freudenreichii]|uniref:CHASE2 domain-containing protein n=1 Tax=Propionibacterium freudenreichii TaxID=1744 RepID=UPI0038523DDC